VSDLQSQKLSHEEEAKELLKERNSLQESLQKMSKEKLKDLDLYFDAINREKAAQERLIEETLEKKKQKKQLGPN
jgi:hypothetical protein